MKIQANRVLLAFKLWEERKKEMEPLLKAGAADGRTLSRLQLHHLRQAEHRLRKTARPDEQPFMLLLNNQVAKLEKQLYPNLLLRLFLRLKNTLIDGPAYLEQARKQRDNNIEDLKIQLIKSGLGSIAGRLEQHLDPEQRLIRLPLDCQITANKRLSLDLNFEMDAYGDFKLNKIAGNLLQNDKSQRAYEFGLNEWPGLKANNILSLLDGRAFKQQYTDATGHENQRWVQFGSNSIHHYDKDYGFDIRTALDALPNIAGDKEKLIRNLENGQQISTHWKQGRQYLNINVQADPANRCIKLLDEKLQPVTAENLGNQLEKKNANVKKSDETIKKVGRSVKAAHHH